MTDTRNTTPPDVRQPATIYITGETKPDAFEVALGEAESGDRIVYHQGQHCGGLHRFAAARAETEKRCFLFCKREYGSTFAYLAVKR
jgi:hypothetical protein